MSGRLLWSVLSELVSLLLLVSLTPQVRAFAALLRIRHLWLLVGSLVVLSVALWFVGAPRLLEAAPALLPLREAQT